MKTKGLILTPRRKAEDTLFERYSGLLDTVCGVGVDEESNLYYFQKEAIRCVFNYMTQYNDLGELIQEHTQDGSDYATYYRRESGDTYLQGFRDREKKIATVDLPTGTGKSFVMFAVAIILYNEIEDIKRIQVIVPSKTISKQLREKFEDLLDKVGRMQDVKLPTLTSLHEEALMDDTLAIDNIHRFYETKNAQLAKEHSFSDGRGKDTLILNDEAHHIYNAEDSITLSKDKNDLRKWLDFILSIKYDFKYIVNFTATPFATQSTKKEKVYLHNVIYRYGLQNAIKDGVVKTVWYIPQGEAKLKGIAVEKQQLESAIEVLQKIKQEFVAEGVDIKPCGVIVCDSIENADYVVEEMKKLGVSQDTIIAYTSKEEHLKNEPLLAGIDNKDNPIEWVVSVGMLTEGWDAKNVFLLVPHERRAFDSKLLISQMVGRGLRRVKELDTKLHLHKVQVLNHRAWGDTKIQMLVNDIVDVSPRIEFGVTNKYHFKVEVLEKKYKDKETDFFSQDSITSISFMDLLSDVCKRFIEQQKNINIDSMIKSVHGDIDTLITSRSLASAYIEREVLVRWYKDNILHSAHIYNKFASGEEFADHILDCAVIKKSEVKDKLHAENLKQLGVAIAEASDGGVIQDVMDDVLRVKSTKDMIRESIGASTFLGQYTSQKPVRYSQDTFDVYTSSAYEKLVQQEKLVQLHNLPEDKQDLSNLRETAEEEIKKKFKHTDMRSYKTPLEVVSWDSEPERVFIEHLLTERNISKVEAWVKSRSRGFYTIGCPVGGTGDTIHFNPDFILRLKTGDTLIVETKGDTDVSTTNAYKFQGLEKHLSILNQKAKGNYYGYMLRRNDYSKFFGEVIQNSKWKHEPDYHRELKGKLQDILRGENAL